MDHWDSPSSSSLPAEDGAGLDDWEIVILPDRRDGGDRDPAGDGEEDAVLLLGRPYGGLAAASLVPTMHERERLHLVQQLQTTRVCILFIFYIY